MYTNVETGMRKQPVIINS